MKYILRFMISQDTSKMSLDFHYSLGEIFGIFRQFSQQS
jgi:hypothetical protein